MILIRTWLVAPRCFKGSVWVLLCQVLHIVVLNCPENAEIPKRKCRNTQEMLSGVTTSGQNGRQSSCYSPFTFSGQVWISDIVTLPVVRPCLASFPPALLRSLSFFRPSPFFPLDYTGLFVLCFSLSLEMWLHKGSHKVWCVHPPVLSPGASSPPQVSKPILLFHFTWQQINVSSGIIG